MSTIFQTAGVKVLKPETHAGIKMLMPWGATQEKGGKSDWHQEEERAK